MAERIAEKLQNAFMPQALEVVDESAQHAGHAGARDGGESHFHIIMHVEEFKGLSRVVQHRKVYEALQDELAASIHALRLTITY